MSGYEVHKGLTAIRTFFTKLFTQLESDANLAAIGPVNGAPVVIEGNKPEGNVFLTWRTQNLVSPDVIKYATDSFSWQVTENVAKVLKQNIVTTEEGTACAEKASHVQSACTAAEEATPKTFCAGWKNHFDYFGLGLNAIDETKMTAALNGIMADYTAESIVQVFDNKDKVYKSFEGIDPIKGMFKTLFEDILAAATDTNDKPGSNGFEVKVKEVENKVKGVFLVWKSNSHPKATDTFVFNDEGKIIRQNIVVETKTSEMNVMV